MSPFRNSCFGELDFQASLHTCVSLVLSSWINKTPVLLSLVVRPAPCCRLVEHGSLLRSSRVQLYFFVRSVPQAQKMFGQAVCAYLWNHLFGNALLCHEKAGNGRMLIWYLYVCSVYMWRKVKRSGPDCQFWWIFLIFRIHCLPAPLFALLSWTTGLSSSGMKSFEIQEFFLLRLDVSRIGGCPVL